MQCQYLYTFHVVGLVWDADVACGQRGLKIATKQVKIDI